MFPIRNAGKAVAPLNEASKATTYPEKSTLMSHPNGATEMNLLKQALSKVRMREPQSTRSEAYPSARYIAMRARHRQARELGSHR
jgi:hypothetical protein